MTTLCTVIATAGMLLASITVVALSCATLIVTVSVPCAPCWSGSGFGSSDTSAAGCGETCTAEDLAVPFADAVIVLSPVASAVAVNTAIVAPCAIVTVAGTCSTAGLLALSAISVFDVCAALIVTVNELVTPAAIVKVAGVSAVTATGGGVTLIAADAVEPLRLAVTPACP